MRPSLIVYGEQGIGDELMFATCLNDAIEDFEVVFECHPRLERLHRNAGWAVKLREQERPVRIFPTRKDEWISWPIDEGITADYKMPIGDLAAYYRPDLQSFKDAWGRHGPTYAASAEESARYQARLQSLAGDRPLVGLATRGGVMQTSRTYRTIRQGEIARLMKETGAIFVCLDYDDSSQLAAYIDESYGPGRFLWFQSIVQHWDYDHTAALVGACDLTLTVCQSVFHLSAGMGMDTLCLTPTRCAWRYATIREEPELSYWYPGGNIRLLRQENPRNWDGPLDRAIGVINALCEQNRSVAA